MISFNFEKAFNWEIPGTSQTVAHKPGIRDVDDDCAAAAQNAGRGKPVTKTKASKTGQDQNTDR